MWVKYIKFMLVFAAIHFALSILAIVKGFIIFHGPSTPSEIFWQGAMAVLLFPVNFLFQTSGTLWAQTIAIFLNSLLWGSAFAVLYFAILERKRQPTKPG